MFFILISTNTMMDYVNVCSCLSHSLYEYSQIYNIFFFFASLRVVVPFICCSKFYATSQQHFCNLKHIATILVLYPKRIFACFFFLFFIYTQTSIQTHFSCSPRAMLYVKYFFLFCFQHFYSAFSAWTRNTVEICVAWIFSVHFCSARLKKNNFFFVYGVEEKIKEKFNNKKKIRKKKSKHKERKKKKKLKNNFRWMKVEN